MLESGGAARLGLLECPQDPGDAGIGSMSRIATTDGCKSDCHATTGQRPEHGDDAGTTPPAPVNSTGLRAFKRGRR
jgi:hypothetical protein